MADRIGPATPSTIPAQARAPAPPPAAPEDPNAVELRTKVSALVKDKFGGKVEDAFKHYDADGDGAINKSEIKNLLSDANIGNVLTRGAWADGVLDKLDTNKDKKVQWAEFMAGRK